MNLVCDCLGNALKTVERVGKIKQHDPMAGLVEELCS